MSSGPNGGVDTTINERFQHVVDSVVTACDTFGVTVLHTDIAGDGVKHVAAVEWLFRAAIRFPRAPIWGIGGPP